MVEKMAMQTLKDKLIVKITRSRREVFLRRDFVKLAGYDQVGRALRTLCKEGTLIKIGYGVYVKARTNRVNGKPMLAAVGGFAQVAQQALNRLHVRWEPNSAVKAYQAGSTQLPASFQPVIKSRFSRKINYGKQTLKGLK